MTAGVWTGRSRRSWRRRGAPSSQRPTAGWPRRLLRSCCSSWNSGWRASWRETEGAVVVLRSRGVVKPGQRRNCRQAVGGICCWMSTRSRPKGSWDRGRPVSLGRCWEWRIARTRPACRIRSSRWCHPSACRSSGSTSASSRKTSWRGKVGVSSVTWCGWCLVVQVVLDREERRGCDEMTVLSWWKSECERREEGGCCCCSD